LKTDDLEIWVSRSTQVKCKDGFELVANRFLFAPYTIWAYISDRLATTRHLALFLKTDDLEILGSRSSKVICKAGSELAAYGFQFAPIQTMTLSATVFEIFNIFICMENPIPTPNLWGFEVKHPKIITVKHLNPQKALPYTDLHI